MKNKVVGEDQDAKGTYHKKIIDFYADSTHDIEQKISLTKTEVAAEPALFEQSLTGVVFVCLRNEPWRMKMNLWMLDVKKRNLYES